MIDLVKRKTWLKLTALTAVLTSSVGTVVFAREPKPAPQREPFTLNATKNSSGADQSTLIPRPSFNLNEGKFDQGRLDASVRDSGTGLTGGAPVFDVSAFKQVPLSGNVEVNKNTQTLRLLSNYDIELIVDESMSMRRMDCPGGLSRWNWCGMQAGQMAKQLAPYVRKGLTISTFAGGYDVYKNATADDVVHLFQTPMFSFGTRMSLPLNDRLNEYLSRGASNSKPLLIAVITDGVPAPKREPMLVVDSLINATRRLRDPREVTIVFFQIGAADFKGKRFLDYLDNGLMADGAKFDIVKNVPMERLARVGLGQALAETINEFANMNRRAAGRTP